MKFFDESFDKIESINALIDVLEKTEAFEIEIQDPFIASLFFCKVFQSLMAQRFLNQNNNF